jgi:hypothetical protein
VSRLQRLYGDEPLHLMATIIAFAIVAAGVAGWFQAGSDPRGILLWVAACAVAFEWIVLPLAWLLDRIAQVATRGAAGAGTLPLRRAAPFLYVPGMLSLLLLVVFAPLIIRADTGSFVAKTGMAPANYLFRWLLSTAAMYGVSAVWYALTLRRAGGGQKQADSSS